MLAGRYRLVSRVGRGGMGTVWEAYDEGLKRRVAVKLIEAEPGAPDPRRHRFEREAWIGGRLAHPNIVRVFDAGEDGRDHFIVMELITGGTLHEWLQERRRESQPLSRAELQTLCRSYLEIVRAVAHCHKQGVLHRDIKPMNILRDAEGERWVLGDFGLARDVLSSRLTRKGDFLGTIAYMAPEQIVAQRATVDERSDIWALGVTLYEALTLRLPFTADSEERYLTALATQDPVAPSQLGPRFERDLETILLKCLRRDPRERYSNTEALAEDLERFLADRPVLARPPNAGDRLRRHFRRRWRVWVLAAATAGAVWIAGGLLLHRTDENQQAEVELEKLEAMARQLEDPAIVQYTGEFAPERRLGRLVFPDSTHEASVRALLQRTGRLQQPRVQRVWLRLSVVLGWSLPSASLRGQSEDLGLKFIPSRSWQPPDGRWILVQFYRRLDEGAWTPSLWILAPRANEELELVGNLRGASGALLEATPHRVEVKARVAWVDASSALQEWARHRRSIQRSAPSGSFRMLSGFGLADTVVGLAWPGDTALVEWRNLGVRNLAIYPIYASSYPISDPNPATAPSLGWLSSPDSIDILWGTVPAGRGSNLIATTPQGTLRIKIADGDQKSAVGSWILRAKFFGNVNPSGDKTFSLRVALVDRRTAKSWVDFPLVLEPTGVRSLFLIGPNRTIAVGGSSHEGLLGTYLYAEGWLARPSSAVPEGAVECLLTVTADRQTAIGQHVDRYVEISAIRVPVRVRFRKAIVTREE